MRIALKFKTVKTLSNVYRHTPEAIGHTVRILLPCTRPVQLLTGCGGSGRGSRLRSFYCLGLRGRLPRCTGRELGTLPCSVIIIGFKRETRIVQPVLGLGIQSGSVPLGADTRRSLERLAGIAHGLHRHCYTPRKNEHTPDYKAAQRFFHESTLAAARSAVKLVDGATITHLVFC